MNQDMNKMMKIQDKKDDYDYMSRQIQQNQEIAMQKQLQANY